MMKSGLSLLFFCWMCLLTGAGLADEQLNGVLWMQTSAEYRMSAVQAFRTAALRVDQALQDSAFSAALEQKTDYQTLPTAVITDVDETMLDNTPFQARLAQTGQEFSSGLWKDWVNEAQAEAVPGALEFIGFLKGQGVELFYVTNRTQKEPTLKNIRAVLDPDTAADHVLCKYEKPEWNSDKTTRRALIAKTHRILLLIGDDYNDFTGLGKTGAEERTRLAEQYEAYWGRKWIVISNPLYGNWERSLYQYRYELSQQEKFDRKMRLLRPNSPSKLKTAQ